MSGALDIQTRERYEKIASMLLHQVPQNQIAAAVGLSEGRISQITDLEEFKEIYAEVATSFHEEQKMLDEAADAIERLAATSVINYLQSSRDPDYALKAFAVANRATRRSNRHVNNTPIPVREGARVVINMPAVFMEKIKSQPDSNFAVIEGQKKMSDMLPVQEVQKLLQSDEAKAESDLQEILAETASA